MLSASDIDNYCFECKKVYSKLDSHCAYNHKHKNNSCPFCNNDYPQAIALSRHILRHHGLQTGHLSTTKTGGNDPCKIQGDDLKQLMDSFVEVEEDAYIITKPSFVLVYDRKRKIVKYSFESKTTNCLTKNYSRDDFVFEPYQPLGLDQMSAKQITMLDFCYDAGHVVAAMMNTENSEDLKNTMIFPNLVPMHRTMNIGMWRSCEFVPKTLLKAGSLWTRVHIISGPIINESNRKRAYGGCLYYVPVELFKVIIMEADDATSFMLCFVFPNDNIYDNIYRYLTDLTTIQLKTGINFTDKLKIITLTKDISQGFRCMSCFKTFISQSEYDEHEKIHKGKVKCKKCDGWFKKSEMIAHTAKQHTTFSCQYCSKVVSSEPLLKSHMRVHTNEKLFVCTFEGCNKRFSLQFSLDSHARTHTGERPYTCPYCDYTAKHMQNIKRHIIGKHKVEPPSYRSSLHKIDSSSSTHQEKGNKIVQIRAKCTHCEETFLDREELKTHRLEKHSVHSCPHCAKIEYSESLMETHLLSHKVEKPYACTAEGCSKSFALKSHLKRHALIHTGEKSFKCRFCNYAATRKDSVSKHIANIHKDQVKSPAPARTSKLTLQVSRLSNAADSSADDSDWDDFVQPPKKLKAHA